MKVLRKYRFSQITNYLLCTYSTIKETLNIRIGCELWSGLEEGIYRDRAVRGIPIMPDWKQPHEGGVPSANTDCTDIGLQGDPSWHTAGLTSYPTRGLDPVATL